MNIKIPSFKGRAPKFDDTSLPDTQASMCTNVRLQSGSLQSYKDFATNGVTLNKMAPTTTIYPLDKDGEHGGPFWLNWNNTDTADTGSRVDVVRSPIVSDMTERTIYTGTKDSTGTLNRPKITNLEMATTTPVQSTGYPYDWLYLGVPAPGTFNGTVPGPLGIGVPLTVTQTINPSVTYSVIADGSSLTGWTLSTQIPGTSIVTLNPTSPPLHPAFDLFVSGTPANPAYTFFPSNVLTGPGSFTVDLTANNVGSPLGNPEYVNVTLGSDINGANGVNIQLPFNTPTTSNVIVGNLTPGWDNPASNHFLGGIPLSAILTFNTVYTLELDYISTPGSLSLFNINIKIIDTVATTVIGNITFSNVVINSAGYIGFVTDIKSNTGAGTDYYVNNVKLKQVQVVNNPNYEATAWTYTYINTLGEESAPAPSTLAYEIGPDLITVLSGFDGNNTVVTPDPTAGYGITSINLYRAVTGTESTQFQFEDNLPLSTTTYTDTKLDTELGEVLSTEGSELPPSDGRNIITLANGITLMSVGNTIYPSDAFLPYSYPTAYQLATEYPIVAMAGIETTAFALTIDSAYLIIGSDPSQLSMSKVAPVYGCVSKKSAQRWQNFGIVYATNQGLAIVNSTGAKLVTEDYITIREWGPLYNPTTIEGAIYENMYYGLYTNLSGGKSLFIFDLSGGNGFIDISLGHPLTTTYTDHWQEKLYGTYQQNLVVWEQGNILGFTWRSKRFQLPYPTSFGLAELRSGFQLGAGVIFNLYKDAETTPYFSTTVTSRKEFVVSPDECWDVQLEVICFANVDSSISDMQISQVAEDLQ